MSSPSPTERAPHKGNIVASQKVSLHERRCEAQPGLCASKFGSFGSCCRVAEQAATRSVTTDELWRLASPAIWPLLTWSVGLASGLQPELAHGLSVRSAGAGVGKGKYISHMTLTVTMLAEPVACQHGNILLVAFLPFLFLGNGVDVPRR